MVKATLNSLSTSITSLTQSVNEIKTTLNSSDIKNQLEITKNSIDSLKRRFDIYEQNQNEIATTIQHINSEHGIKIQRLEDTLITATTTLENLSTSTSALQDTMNNILSHIQSYDNNISSITNTTINSPRAIMVANPVLTANVHDKMRYFNGFDDESQSQDQTNEKWNETTIIEICGAYFKTLKKEPALNKIPESNLNYPKIEVEKLFSFEATSPEVSDAEEIPISGSNDLDISQSFRRKLLVLAIHIRGLVEDFIKRNRVEKLNSGGRHSYTTPLPREIIKMDDPRWITMRSMIPPKPKDFPNWAWNQIDPSEYFENSDDIDDDIYE
ncbi:6940_t:CDS:2 [Dentiscutata heterogama]|uniref:6940_t:CDS:1 n=1 Tax=Dentiscutata heterogama TaxID=1316150 RepID=A0ACA9KPB7_9GLOM|nr:6940_t:CDS:2 [Dentiscutata heterogama]